MAMWASAKYAYKDEDSGGDYLEMAAGELLQVRPRRGES